jgi:hypothetical protein
MEEGTGVVRSIFDLVFPQWSEWTQIIINDNFNFHFVSSGFREINVGRGKECDIEIIDSSISRDHAKIYSNSQNDVFMEDNSSKYGTYVGLNGPIKLLNGQPLSLVRDNHLI